MKARAITAGVYSALIIICALIGELAVTSFLLFLSVWASYEFAECHHSNKKPVNAFYTAILSLITFLVLVFLVGTEWQLPILFVLLLVFMCAQITAVRKHGTRVLSVPIFSQIYVVLPLVLFARLSIDLGVEWFILIYCGVVGADTMAYLTGRFFGKRKMWPTVSPAKTWEGFFGGILGSWLLIQLYLLLFNFIELTQIQIFWISLTLALSGSLGDFLQSAWKRNLDIKDSGKRLPGHGGILDRIDSILIAVPAIFVLLKVLLDVKITL